MNIAIIKYNAGNTKSVGCALERLGYSYKITAELEEIKNADKVIFPGVGEASTAMMYLKEKKLDLVIKDLKQPFLGICLGMQLMCSYSEENNTKCLDIFSVGTKKFPNTVDFKIPHMGWNTINKVNQTANEKKWFYFVHSYYVPVCEFTESVCSYANIEFSAILKKDNFFGCQFHPEKSSKAGEELLRSFLCE